MKKMYLLPPILLGTLSFGQIGINNPIPKSTLDVMGKTKDGSRPEGFILPRIKGNALKAAETHQIYGNVLATAYNTPSDIRIKKDITDSQYGLKEIMNLRTITYRYKDNQLGKEKNRFCGTRGTVFYS